MSSIACAVLMMGGVSGNLAFAQSASPPLDDVVKVVAGGTFACAIVNQDTSKTAGEVWCWGSNGNGELGINDSGVASSSVALKIADGSDGFQNQDIETLVLGANNACAIQTGELYCWGSNEHGKSGNSSASTSPTSKILTPTKVPLPSGATAWTAVTLGDEHSCGLVSNTTQTGVAYCWGHGDLLGNGALYDTSPPGQGFSDTPPTYPKSTNNSESNPTPTLVVSTDTTIFNRFSSDFPVFHDVANTGFDLIAAGVDHTCAVKKTGSEAGAYCWGNNQRSQTNFTDYGLIWQPAKITGNRETSPRAIFDGSGIKKLVAGAFNACVIKDQAAYSLTDAVFCWGNLANSLGTPNYIAAPDSTTGNPPVTGFDHLAVYRNGQLTGGRGMCGVLGGVVKCFGTGRVMSLETIEDLQPGEMTANTGVTDLSMGGQVTPYATQSSCVVKENRAYCWGDNNAGQLGNDTTTASATPVLVRQALPPMEAPTNVVVTPGNGELSITFDAGNTYGRTITDYEYQQTSPNTLNPPPWVSAGVTQSPVIIAPLSNGQAYGFKLRAVAGNDVSPEVTVAGTPVCTTCPDKPSGLSVTTASDGTAKLFFFPPQDNTDITNYEYLLQGTGISSSQWTALSPAQTSGPIEFSSLTNGGGYQVYLRSVAGSLKSLGAGPADFTVGGTNPPIINSVTASDQSITIEVELSPAQNADSFDSINAELYSVGTNGSQSFQGLMTQSGPDSNGVYTFTQTGLTNDQVYEIKVNAFYNLFIITLSSYAQATPKAPIPPAAPTGLTAEAGDRQASITFTAGASGDAAISNYEYQLDGGSWVALNPVDTTSPVIIPNLTNGTQYSIKLRAVSSVGPGAESVAVTVTPENPAGPPSKLTIAIDGKLQSIDPQLKNLPFDVVVRLTDKDGNPVENTGAVSVITLTASGGVDATGKLAKVGALDQPVTASLAVGQSAVTITDLVYTGLSDTNGGDITLSATGASGLADGKSGTSAAFSVRDIKLTVTADDTSIVADGQSTATITVTLTDVNDAGQAGQNIRITTDKGKLFAGSAEVAETDVFPTNAQGQVTFTLQSATTPGTATVTAFCPGACPATLEVGFFSQQAVNDIASFDASSDEPPTAEDYEKAGVSGVDTDSVGPINSVVDDLPTADRDTPEEIQVVADVVNEILDSADGDPLTPPDLDANDYAAIGLSDVDEAEEVSLMNTVIAEQTPANLFPFAGLKGIAATVVDVIELADTGADPQLTVKRLSDVGLKSVNESTLTPIVDAIKAATPTDIDTLAKLQGVVNGVIDQVVAATIGAFDEDTSTTPPSTDDYADVGITGVTDDNLAVVNSLVGSLPAADRDSGAEVQAVVDVVAEILEKADRDNTNLPDLTADDFAAIGLSEVDTAQEVALMNAVLGSQPVTNVNTAAKLKAYGSAVTRMIQTANGTLPSSAAPLSVAEFVALGIEGVTEENIDKVIELLASQGTSAVTLELLQTIAEEARPALPVPTLHLWSMLLLMLIVLWLAQRDPVGVLRQR